MRRYPILIVSLVTTYALLAAGCVPPAAPIAAPATSAASVDAAAAAAIDSIAAAAVESGAVAGISVAVANDGEIEHARGYGYANIEERVPATDSTIFRIGSVTKQFTAAAILRLAEQGEIGLDDNINRYLPDFPTQGHTVTIHHLLNHTSGIKSYTGLPDFLSRMAEDLSHEEMLARFRGEPFDFAPGERYAYSNSGYYLLGLIIEEVTGMDYAEYLEAEFFRPLRLTRTGYCPNEPEGANHAHGYAVAGESPRPAMPIHMSQPFAAGALCSSVRDLVRWQQALAGGEVVSAASYRRMTTPAALPGGETMSYGYGLVAEELEGYEKIHHGGGINGFISELAYYPEEDITIAVLTNTEGPAAYAVEEAIARHRLGIPEPVRENLPLTAKERARYTGTYDLGPLELRVFEQDDRLMAQATNQPAFPLLYQGDHEFLLDVPAQEIRLVFVLEEGRAESLVLHQGGAVIPAERVR